MIHRAGHDGVDRDRVCQDRGLRVLGERELVLGALEHDAGKVDAQGVVDRLKDLARGWKPLCHIPTHPNPLRPLARTEPDHRRRDYHFTTMLAQVKPAPNATSSTVIPGTTRPVRTASSSAIATDAAEVLP